LYTCILLDGFVDISLLDNVFLKYIDAYLLVFGEINTQVMMQKFEICRAKSSRIFTIYREGRPTNMRDDFSRKCYVKGAVFEPIYLKDESAPRFLAAIDTVFTVE
jgi:hypothetical protein